jgi:opacity protein-like surface antigen
MRRLVFAAALLGAAATAAHAQDAVPDLKGTWTGKGKSIVFGSHPHHPGQQTPTDPPRVRDIEATYIVDGQDGRLVWGRSSSSVANTMEPFGWAIASDNRSIVGADMDGYYRITLVSPDRIEKCYVHNATGPSRSIVATCHMMDRVKK